METNQAAENLQVIRTLMERSALYRRALAPLMTYAGLVGTVASAGGWWMRIESVSGFAGYWMVVAVVGVVGSLLLVRRQALKSAEPFWSPPTRRLVQAVSPPFAAGLLIGVLFCLGSSESPPVDPPTGMGDDAGPAACLAAIWALFYGCALHAAGFFTPRGLRWFGWGFVVFGSGVLILMVLAHRQDYPDASWRNSHLLMGFFFGALHLAYGAYLYLTEQRKNVA